MGTATYVGKLAKAGLDPQVAQAHGEAIEELLSDNTVTKDCLESRLSDMKASIYQAMFLQALGTVGLTVALLKLLP